MKNIESKHVLTIPSLTMRLFTKPLPAISLAFFISTMSLAESDDFDDSPESNFDLHGFASVSFGGAESNSSWLEGGFGRLDVGDSNDQRFSFDLAEIQLAMQWSVTDSTLIYLHGRGRDENTSNSTKKFGLVEGFIEVTAFQSETDDISIQFGQIFLPTSQENVESLWQSPYTLTFSTWNSWIAQELRPISLNISYQTETFEGNLFSAKFGLLQGSDSLGSQLAWGGWRMSRRLSVTNEVLPLGPLFTLKDNAVFHDQRNDGSQPIGGDLDDRIGFHAHLSWQNPDVFSIKVSYFDNRGDRQLHRGEYAWDTSFFDIGYHWQIDGQWELLGEFVRGKTGMGGGLASVDADFSNVYIMSSWKQGANRISLRYEDFELQEKDFSLAENNNDSGNAWTIAWIYQNDSPWQLGLEYVSLRSKNAAQIQSGFVGNNQEKMLTFELRRSIN